MVFSYRCEMNPNVLSPILLVAVVSLPFELAAQSDSVLPASGSYGVSFGLPSGGGAAFGVRKMISSTTNAGLEIQIDFAWSDNAPAGAQRTRFALGVSPDLRLYRGSSGPVVPFLELGLAFTYQNGPADFWGVNNAVGVGLGVEWFPLEAISVSGSTGARASYQYWTATGGSNQSVGVSLFHSELLLNLYF